ncbi:MAG: hypothetical protein K2H14_08985, partial [Muribaculaceae bacterium]|nr:hypothetical protein [Muribaculaceae bacterium]
QRLLEMIWRRNKEREDAEEREQEIRDKVGRINRKETYVLRYDDKGDSNFKFSDCCSPIPGDEVMGFIDDNGDVVVHSLDCPRANALKASFGQRILSTRWEVSGGKFLASIHIEGIDRHGILHELISLISSHLSFDIRALDIKAENEVFFCDLSLLVSDVEGVNDLCAKVRKISGVKRVSRVQ